MTTGGRAATDAVIRGRCAISVNDPGHPTPVGWVRVALTDVADLGTGHTPSRLHQEYWNGDIAWIGIRDAAGHHGGLIDDTSQHISELGLANSAARLLPRDTVCLSRTASVGYVVKLGREMATSQDFVAWTCGNALDPDFLMNALLAEGDDIRRFGEGSTHTTIYFPEIKAFHVDLPPLAEQRRIVAKLDALTARIARARAELESASARAVRLREAGLEKAFPEVQTKPDKGSIEAEFQIVRFDQAAEIASQLVAPETILDLPHIAPNHIQSGRPKLLSYQTIREDGVISGKHRFFPGQVLYSKIRPNLRKVVQVDFEGGCSADMYPISPKCHARYLMYWMLSPQFTSLATRQDGRTLLPKINQAALNAIPTPLASPEKQKLIADRLDEIFARADRLEAEAARARALLDRLESAILAKAFRGELVPQDPNDEPASVLLERIRAQRAASPKPKRYRRAS